MSGFEIHQEPDYAYRMFLPVAPAMTFDVGDPVRIVTNQLADTIDDQTELLVGECVGFACEPAEGTTAGSRATAAADGFGVVEGQVRTYWPFNAPGLLLRTRNFVLAADFFTQVEKDYTEIGDDFNIKGQTGTNVWGVEEEAPTYATGAGTVIATDSLAVLVVAVLDNDMNPLATDATQTAGDGWLVFKPIGYSQIEFGGA